MASDDFGSLNVYRYPVLSNTHQSQRLTGHSEHVVRARFWNEGDLQYIISAGGNDRSYIQWKEVKE